MKNFLLLTLFSFFLFTATSQVVTGVYKGKMEVDSPKYTIDFELTLKEKNGKLMGYCHRLFIVEDVLYYNLVKVTARVADSVLIVEDEKSVSNNFKERTSGVKTVMFFKIQTDHDTVSVMPGEWSTSRTKKYLPITGSIAVRREQNYLATQLYNRLEDKQLATEMLFEEKTKPQPVLVSAPITTPETKKEQPAKTDVAKTEPTQQINQPTTSNQPVKLPTAKDSAQTNTSIAANQQQTNVQKTDVAVNQPKQQNNQTTKNTAGKPVAKKDSIQTSPNTTSVQQQSNIQKTDLAVNKPKQQTNQPANNNQPAANTTGKPTTVQSKDSIQSNTTAAANQQKSNVQKTDVAVNQPKQQTNQPSNNSRPVTNTPNKPTTVPSKDSVKNNTSVAVNQPKQQPTTTAANKPETKPVTPVVTNPPVQQQQTEAGITSIGQITKEDKNNQPVASGKPPVINNPMIIKRTTEIIEALEVTGDSVVLSLYDNGEIDGDTVSVFLNNEMVLAKVGLRAQAFKHTIAIRPGEVVQLTLFAENLGSIPPNTGLLVLTTNDQRYQVNFSSTLNKSSSIVIRRKE
ncbi:hypothetical protein [Lacibacter sp. H407]|uniref:hypothetical protein n=1 Tax=Lacibacter sp. H407 TaxID=3133423 RepID=UPI0030C34869